MVSELFHNGQPDERAVENNDIVTETLFPDEVDLPEEIQEMNNKENDYITIDLNRYPERIKCGVSSVIGSRKYQQDAAGATNEYEYADTNIFAAIMCDGMGGMNGGERASNECVSSVMRLLPKVDIHGRVPQFLKITAEKLDMFVRNMKNDAGRRLGAGTTLTCVIIDNDNLFWVSVGDSRIYLARGDEILPLTVDHNYKMLLDMQVKSGKITAHAAETDPEKESLISYIGMGGLKYIDINSKPIKLIQDDCILLCSDGLYRTVSDAEILSILKTPTNDMKSVADKLTMAAIAKGKRNQDNTTAVVVKFIN